MVCQQVVFNHQDKMERRKGCLVSKHHSIVLHKGRLYVPALNLSMHRFKWWGWLWILGFIFPCLVSLNGLFLGGVLQNFPELRI